MSDAKKVLTRAKLEDTFDVRLFVASLIVSRVRSQVILDIDEADLPQTI